LEEHKITLVRGSGRLDGERLCGTGHALRVGSDPRCLPSRCAGQRWSAPGCCR
jgi:hypothetical protein